MQAGAQGTGMEMGVLPTAQAIGTCIKKRQKAQNVL
jgi:hypothetical protein